MTPPKKENPEQQKKAETPAPKAQEKRPPQRKAAAKPAMRKVSAKGTDVRSTRRSKPKIGIGIDVDLPKKTCDDKFCPFHGTLPVRGQILEGKVVSDRMQRTVVVERQYMRNIEKYERLEKRYGKYLAHSPPCLEVAINDRVRIMECRPLSKTVSYVVIEKLS